MKLEKLKNAEIKKNEMISIKGGTTTTLITVVGIAENEYEDTDKDGKVDTKKDKFLGTIDLPI